MNRYVLCVIAMLMITSFAFRHGHTNRHQARVQAKAKNHYAAMARAKFTQGPGPVLPVAPTESELNNYDSLTPERDAEITFYYIDEEDYQITGLITDEDYISFLSYDDETGQYFELSEQAEVNAYIQFETADTNGDGLVDLNEFTAAYLAIPEGAIIV